MFLDCKDNVYISESECVSEIGLSFFRSRVSNVPMYRLAMIGDNGAPPQCIKS